MAVSGDVFIVNDMKGVSAFDLLVSSIGIGDYVLAEAAKFVRV